MTILYLTNKIMEGCSSEMLIHNERTNITLLIVPTEAAPIIHLYLSNSWVRH